MLDDFQGIPDTHEGRVIVKKHTYTGTFTASATNDSYIILLPMAGYAYFTGTRAAGTGVMTLTGQKYSDFSTLFPSTAENSVVSAFRIASNVIELIPTVNATSWSGSIQVWKAPITFIGWLASPPAPQIAGFDAVDSTKPQTVLPFNHGCYVPTRNIDNNYPFASILQNCALSTLTADGSASAMTFAGGNVTGFGTQEAVFIKIPASSTNNTAIVRVWSCVEYAVSPTSALYEYSRLSAPYDPLALALLSRFMNEHCCAVPYYDNDTFWKTFMSWAKTILHGISFVPGPVGEISGALGTIAEVVDALI